jgi:hypothetical protein
VIQPFNPDPPGGKFAPAAALPDPDRLPVPNPPLPLPEPRIDPLPIPPAPEPARPTLLIFENLPVIPYRPIETSPLPFSGLSPQK